MNKEDKIASDTAEQILDMGNSLGIIWLNATLNDLLHCGCKNCLETRVMIFTKALDRLEKSKLEGVN